MSHSRQRIAERAHIYYSYISSRLSSATINHIPRPTAVFMFLLDKYLRNTQSIQCDANRQFARNMQTFKTNITLFPEKFAGKKYFISVMAALNSHHARLDASDDFIPMLHAFFSTYTHYQQYLNDDLMKKIAVVDKWTIYAESWTDHAKQAAEKKLQDIFEKEKQADLFSEINNGLDSQLGYVINRELVPYLPTAMSEYLLQNLNRTAVHILIRKPSIISPDLYSAIKYKIFSLLQIENIDNETVYRVSLACDLIVFLHASVLTKGDKKAVIDQLKKLMEFISFRTDVLNAIAVLHHDMSTETKDKVIKYLLIDLELYPSTRQLGSLLTLYAVVNEKKQAYIQSVLSEIINEKDRNPLEIYIESWPIWNEDVQHEVATQLITHLAQGDEKMRSWVFAKLYYLSRMYSFKKEQDQLVNVFINIIRDLHCIAAVTAIRLINKLCTGWTRENREKLVDTFLALQKDHKQLIKDQQISHRIHPILFKLNRVMALDKRDSMLNEVFIQFHEDIDAGVLSAIATWDAYLPKDQLNDMLVILMAHLKQWLNDDKWYLLSNGLHAVDSLLTWVDKPVRKNSIKEIIGHFTHSHMGHCRKIIIDLVASHLADFDYHERVAVMFDLVKTDYRQPDTDYIALYQLFYQANAKEFARANLQYLPDAILPGEMIEKVVNSMRL